MGPLMIRTKGQKINRGNIFYFNKYNEPVKKNFKSFVVQQIL